MLFLALAVIARRGLVACLSDSLQTSVPRVLPMHLQNPLQYIGKFDWIFVRHPESVVVTGGIRALVVAASPGAERVRVQTAVPAGDAPALAERVSQVLGDRALRSRLSEAGRASARRFSIEGHVEAVQRVYAELLEPAVATSR